MHKHKWKNCKWIEKLFTAKTRKIKPKERSDESISILTTLILSVRAKANGCDNW